MRGNLFFSLRSRLVGLVLLAVLPALGLSIYAGLQQRHHALMDAQGQVRALALGVSAMQDGIVDEARALLSTLAEIPQVQQRDAAACNQLFAAMLPKNSRYTAILAFNPDGKSFASYPAKPHAITVTDRPWYRRLLETRDFVVTEYLLGRTTGKPVIAFANPVFDPERRLQAIVLAALDLEWLKKFIATTKLPKGATLTVVDRNGTILAQHPDPEEFVGRAMPEAPIIKATLLQGEGMVEAPGLDGVPRIFAFTYLGPSSTGVHVAVGIPEAEVFAGVRRDFIIHLGGLGLMALLALTVAWVGGEAFIRRQVNDLLSVTRRLGQGDLEARTGPPYHQGELGQLACAFDDMAGALQRWDAARREALEELRQAQLGLEAKVAERTAEAEEARRRADLASRAKSDFLASMSHELRTPLNSILGFSEVLQDQMFGPVNDKQNEYLGHILTSGRHLLSLINDILDLSKVESGKMEAEYGPLKVREALSGALLLVKEKALKHGLELGLELGAPEDLEIVSDPRKFKQVVYNLLSNAVKFTPDGGRVTVRAGWADLTAAPRPGRPDLRHLGHRGLEISVEDTGVGIKTGDLPKLFQEFSQLDRSVYQPAEGTGLGLALSKKLVELLGGVIWAESEYGQGSRFSFVLPVPGRT